MPIIPVLVLLVSVAALAVVTWYLMIPVMILWGIWQGVCWIKRNGAYLYGQRVANGCRLRRTPPVSVTAPIAWNPWM